MKQRNAAILILCLAASVLRSRAQVFQVIDNLGGGQGSQPYAGLTVEGSVLFGTTSAGGLYGGGNLFKLNEDGSGLTDLYDFTTPAQASSSKAELVLFGSTLYGSGYQGGSGDGTVFAIGTSGAGYTNLHVFSGGSDGSHPRGTLVLSNNVLYGATQFGAAGAGNGTLFSLNTDSTGFVTLHTFSGPDGSQPCGGLVVSSNVLYGATSFGGGSGLGAVFSLSTDGKFFNLLHSFSNTDGALPSGGLLLSGGALYGTTATGGALGNGTVYSIGADGTGFTVIHDFAGGAGDGAAPLSALVLSSNLLYGTTSGGGASGRGTIFSIATNGANPTLLYSFSGGNDGGIPESPLLLAGDELFGTALSGGGGSGSGTVFGVKLSGVVIAQQPPSRVGLHIGDEADFSSFNGFSLNAAAALQYQWRLNGVNIPGATGRTFAWQNVQLTNGGSVTVAVSDGTDAPNSSPALLLVPAPLQVTNNDDFSNRFVMPAVSGTLNDNNSQATKEPGEPDILPGNPGGKSVWFEWQAPVSGIAFVTTTGSAFDTMLGVFTGSSVSALTREPSAIADDDSGGYLTSKVWFNCVANQNYEIDVDGYWGASGDIVLTWNIAETNAALPVILTTPPPLTVVSNGATVTLNCQASVGTPVWFLNGQPTGITGANNVINSVSTSDVGAWVAQVSSGGWTVSTQPSLLEINTLEDGTTGTNSAAFYKFFDTVVSTFIQTSLPVIRKLNGGDTRGYSVSQSFSTVNAQGEPGEPNIAGQIGGSPAWYKYVAPTNGSLLVNTAGSSFNTLLGVFTGPGDSFATLTSLGAGYTTNSLRNGQPSVFIANVPAGQTNYIVVDGYRGASGTVQLNIGLGVPLSVVTTPPSQFVLAGTNSTFTASASGSTPITYQWLFGGTNLSGATNSSLTITNVQTASTGIYAVIVSNLVSTITNTVSLGLAAAPVILVQPQSHTVTSNTTATLSVTATGGPPPSYQWLFNGASTGGGGNPWSITNFSPANEGTYSVLVSNVLGVVPSSNAVLLLDAPLRVADPSLSNNSFQLEIIGVAGGTYVLESSTNLSNWLPISTNYASFGFIFLSDPNTTNRTQAFYRAATN